MRYHIAVRIYKQRACLLRASRPVVVTEYAVFAVSGITCAAKPKRAIALNTRIPIPLKARAIVFSLLTLRLALTLANFLLGVIPPVTALCESTPAARLRPAKVNRPSARAELVHEARESHEVFVPRVLYTVATKR